MPGRPRMPNARAPHRRQVRSDVRGSRPPHGWIARASVSSLSGSAAGPCRARSFTSWPGNSPPAKAGLIAVGEPTIEKALTKADKVVKRNVAATTDEITSELQEALKS